jgi:hypothetical protein
VRVRGTGAHVCVRGRGRDSRRLPGLPLEAGHDFQSIPPGEVLKDYLGDMTAKEAAKRLGVTRPNLSIGCCQEIVQDYILCTLYMSGALIRDLALLWIFGLHGTPRGPNESHWEFTSVAGLGTVALGS